MFELALSAIFQYGCQRGTFKFVVTYVRQFSNMHANALTLNFFLPNCAVLLKFMLTNFKFQLALFAIFKYGYLRGTFKIHAI